MAFNLNPYAAVIDGYVVRWLSSADEVAEGEVALPVIADADPQLAADEVLWGPNFEVLADRVRAYGTAVKADPSTLAQLTFAQMLIGLVSEAWITEADGDGWLAGMLPTPVIGLINTLPEQARFPAKARAIRPSNVLRHDPLVEMLGAAQGKTAAELDAFFSTYSQV